LKVIFIADVPKVARAGQTKEVANGYARNFLFPRKLAVLANSTTAASLEMHLKKVLKQRAIEEEEMAAIAKQINGVEILLKAKVGEKDKLYGSVTGADIAEELAKIASREIDKRKIELAEPIRQVGVYDITIRFTHEITAVVQVTVMSDAEGAPVPVKEEKAETPVEAKKEKKEKKPTAEKPPKEKKPKAEKAVKEETPVEEKPAEEEPAKAEKKKPRTKAEKKEETEEKKE
jgi:large subunit ribosomal protein L9